jgi:hypothetical protein
MQICARTTRSKMAPNRQGAPLVARKERVPRRVRALRERRRIGGLELQVSVPSCHLCPETFLLKPHFGEVSALKQLKHVGVCLTRVGDFNLARPGLTAASTHASS